jgi:phosphatidylserine/phosphatidylglycerophosphate/cardiolipin synthase-like enzyme
MIAIYWQIGISLSIIGTYFILNRQATNEYLSPERGLKLISIAWVVWTILGPLREFSPLFIVQFLNIFISYRIAKKFLKKDNEAEQLKSTINQLKQDLKNIDNRRLNKSYKKFKDSIIPVIGAQSHRNLLLSSLNEAQESLVILSGWVTEYAINDEFKNLVRKCLDRGVQIYIGYGYQMKKSGKKISNVKKLETESLFKELQEWCGEYEKKGRINVWYYPNHSKVLICDKKYIVCGSFNWLSNIGNSSNEERSYKIQDRDFIEDELSEIINSLHSPLKATKRHVLKFFHKWSDY